LTAWAWRIWLSYWSIRASIRSGEGAVSRAGRPCFLSWASRSMRASRTLSLLMATPWTPSGAGVPETCLKWE
jgi:hypothetical protein